MKAQFVRAVVPADRRSRYLQAWSEWSGTLLSMGIRTELLQSEDREGEYLEVTWFEEGQEAALGDDRLVRIAGDLDRIAENRQGMWSLFRSAGT